MKFPKISDDLALKFYLQAGYDVDGIPPIDKLLPTWNKSVDFKDTPKRVPDFSKSGNGFVMGSSCRDESRRQFRSVERICGW